MLVLVGWATTAAAGCSIELLSPGDMEEMGEDSPQFSWQGDCEDYKVVLSPSGTFEGDRRHSPWRSGTMYRVGERAWAEFVGSEGAAGSWWGVIGRAADGSRAYSEVRFLSPESDLGDPVEDVCLVDNGGCGDATCVTTGPDEHVCVCPLSQVWEDDVCVPEASLVSFIHAERSVRADIGTVTIDLTRSAYASSSATVPYTLSGELMGNPASGEVVFPQNQSWVTLTLLVDAEPGSTLTVTLGSPTGSELGEVVEHTITVVEDSDACLSVYPLLGTHRTDDVDADGIPDGCDTDLAPEGLQAAYLQPVAATASTNFGIFNLNAQYTIQATLGDPPPAESFVFVHDWNADYAVYGSWLTTSSALPQWFAVDFGAPVVVDEIRLVNFAHLGRNGEWRRGIHEFAVYGSNESGVAPAVYGSPRADMHYLGMLSATSAQDRTWMESGAVEGLPEVFGVPAPGEYRYLFLEILSSQRADQSGGYPNDLSGFRKIEFATYE
jgi:hypothetical protein